MVVKSEDLGQDYLGLNSRSATHSLYDFEEASPLLRASIFSFVN